MWFRSSQKLGKFRLSIGWPWETGFYVVAVLLICTETRMTADSIQPTLNSCLHMRKRGAAKHHGIHLRVSGQVKKSLPAPDAILRGRHTRGNRSTCSQEQHVVFRAERDGSDESVEVHARDLVPRIRLLSSAEYCSIDRGIQCRW